MVAESRADLENRCHTAHEFALDRKNEDRSARPPAPDL